MHLMIDLETLGLTPNTVVTQIGMCLFNLNETMVSSPLLLHLDPQDQINRGRRMDWDTISWWLQQSPEAQNAMVSQQRYTPYAAMQTFLTTVQVDAGWNNIEGVWSNGPSFDQTIMEDLFFMYGMKTPWKYNAGRDVRTMAMLTPEVEKVRPTVAHNAMDDAIAQATYVQNSYRALKGIK